MKKNDFANRRNMSRYFLIVDIGGTKTSGALFSEEGILTDDYVFVAESKTFSGKNAIYENTKYVLNTVLDHFGTDVEDIIGIGVGAPGPLDSEKGVIIGSPMLGMENFPLAELLMQDYHKPVRIENDGNLGALAEQRRGKGKNKDNVLYMTVSTGCGGGAVLNRSIYHGYRDGAAEFGHISIDLEGKECPCHGKGCLELYASGTAMNRMMVEDMQAGKKSSVFEKAGYDPKAVNGKILNEAAAEGDSYALEMYRKEGYYLGCALSILFNTFSPDVFVLGGGVTKAKQYFHNELMKQLKTRAVLEIEDDRVQYSEMNDKVVLYGAYYLIKEYLEKAD